MCCCSYYPTDSSSRSELLHPSAAAAGGGLGGPFLSLLGAHPRHYYLRFCWSRSGGEQEAAAEAVEEEVEEEGHVRTSAQHWPC